MSLIKDKNLTFSQLKVLDMPILKMYSVFEESILSGKKKLEFRKASKHNQTGGVKVFDVSGIRFLFFMYLEPIEINPYAKKRDGSEEGIFFPSKRTSGFAEEGRYISKTEYSFLINQYVGKDDFIMFEIIKVVK